MRRAAQRWLRGAMFQRSAVTDGAGLPVGCERGSVLACLDACGDAGRFVVDAAVSSRDMSPCVHRSPRAGHVDGPVSGRCLIDDSACDSKQMEGVHLVGVGREPARGPPQRAQRRDVVMGIA